MRSSHIGARALFAVLAGLLFGRAPAAAQDLVPVTGAPVAYRVNLPGAGWNTSNENGMLMVGRDDAMIVVTATDLTTLQQRPANITEAQHRTALTQRFMASDSVMLDVMSRVVAGASTLEPEGLVKEIRTLGGQRAAYIRDRKVENGSPKWRQAYITVKDGIMYMLVFIVQDTALDTHKDLFDRVQQSFALAETPR